LSKFDTVTEFAFLASLTGKGKISKTRWRPIHISVFLIQDEELRYGPFSDGEAETLRRSCHKSYRRTASGGSRGHPNGSLEHHLPPHYVTMTRGHGRLAARNGGGERVRDTSQPLLTGCDYQQDGNCSAETHRRIFTQTLSGNGHGGRCESPDTLSLPPLSVRTSITFPRRPAHEQSVSGLMPRQEQEVEEARSGYPDLARHPLSYTTAPPPQYHAHANNQG